MRARHRLIWISLLTMMGLLLASCAPAQAPAPTVKPTAAAAPTAPAAGTPAAPAASPKPAADKSRSGGVINTIGHSDPPSFDIHQEGSHAAFRLLVPNYSALVQYDPSDARKIIGDLAEKWEASPDGTAYTFQLRPGAKWHDGRPVTAEDVQVSFDRIRKPPQGMVSPRQANLQAIASVEVPTATTVKITLRYPQAAFLAMIATGWEAIMPKHVIETKGNMKRDIVGSGPFKLSNYVPGVSFEVKKNGYHVAGRPYLDAIKFFIMTDNATRFAALRTKRVHLTNQANGITPAQAEIIKKDNPEIAIALTKLGGHWTLIMRNDREPWNDIRVRRAVNLALDRQAAVRLVSDGFGDVGGPLPPTSWAMAEDQVLKAPGFRQPKDADLAEARKLMAEAGLAEGIKGALIFRSGSIYERGAVYMRDQLAKIGITASVEARDFGSYMNLLAQRGFTLVAHKDAVESPDPEVWLGQRYLPGSPKNYGNYNDPEFDKLFEEQSRAVDPAKRKAVFGKIEERLLSQVPNIVSHWESYLLGQWREVRDFTTGHTIYSNATWRDVWLAQ